VSEEEQETTGGVVSPAPEFYEEIGEFSKLFAHKQPMAEAARFAMAIGIAKNLREPRKKWKKGKKRRAWNMGSFSDNGKFDFDVLFNMLDLMEEGTPVHRAISEYITGGMRWIVENEMIDGSNFAELKDEFPDLFTAEE